MAALQSAIGQLDELDGIGPVLTPLRTIDTTLEVR